MRNQHLDLGLDGLTGACELTGMAFGSKLPNRRRFYFEKLQDPLWLKKREEIIRDRGEKCEICGQKSRLEVHHGYYLPGGVDPWLYDKSTLWCLCRVCHEKTQKRMTAMHRVIGETHPRDLDALASKLGDVAFEVQTGFAREELEQILAEDRAARATLYRDYHIDYFFSNEMGPTRIDEVERLALDRFPGIEITSSEVRGTRDCIATVTGPDMEICATVQAWVDRHAS